MYDQLYVSDTVDDSDRGPFTIIESDAVDGNVMDVYGETPEHSRERANQIIQLIESGFMDIK